MVTLLPLIPKGLEPRNLAQWVRALASHAKGLVFKFQPRQTQVVKTDSKSSTAKRSAISVTKLKQQQVLCLNKNRGL